MTTFLIGVLCLNLAIAMATGFAFRRIHQNQGRKDLSAELFRQYREDRNRLESWLCKGAVIQATEEAADASEINNLRRRVLAPMR